MSLQDFYIKLEQHDWFYEMSDDHRVWQKGKDANNLLARQATIDPEYFKLYEAYRRYVFSGPEFGNEKKPKPRIQGDLFLDDV